MFDGFVSWARRTAIRLEDPIRATTELEGFLARALVGKRILFVGEADHWVHEKIDYRLAFAQAALAAGFDWFGEELGWSDGLRIDDWLHDRPGASLSGVTLFGHRDELRSDRDDTPTGVLRASYENPPDAVFRDEHVRLLEGLRAIARRRPALRFFGFDVDGLPGGAYADLAGHGPGVLPVRVLSELVRRPGESLPEETARLTGCLESLVRDAPDADWEIRTSLETLRDSLAYTALAHPAPTYEALAPAMALRERVMQRQVGGMLERLPSDHGVVLWGHDLHLARNDAGIRQDGGTGPGGDSADSLGHHLNRRHADEIYVVWMVFGGGEDGQPFPDLDRVLRPPRRSLNGLLQRVGGSFVLPTRSDDPAAARLKEKARLYHLYNGHAELRIAEQADAICFIDAVSPLRPAAPG
jgi:erythromycin esterase-like protein